MRPFCTAIPALLLPACGPLRPDAQRDPPFEAVSVAGSGPSQSLNTVQKPLHGGSDRHTGDPAEGSSPTEAPGQPLPRSGEWVFDHFELTHDPCGWRPFMESLPFGIGDLLPTSFAIDAERSGFFIEAMRYGGNFGASGPVYCAVEGPHFECEAQTIAPVDLFLARYGWRYTAQFSGEIVAPHLVDGISTVTFQSVDDDTRHALDRTAHSLPECTQQLDMRLRLDTAS